MEHPSAANQNNTIRLQYYYHEVLVNGIRREPQCLYKRINMDNGIIKTAKNNKTGYRYSILYYAIHVTHKLYDSISQVPISNRLKTTSNH